MQDRRQTELPARSWGEILCLVPGPSLGSLVNGLLLVRQMGRSERFGAEGEKAATGLSWWNAAFGARRAIVTQQHPSINQASKQSTCEASPHPPVTAWQGGIQPTRNDRPLSIRQSSSFLQPEAVAETLIPRAAHSSQDCAVVPLTRLRDAPRFPAA